MTPFHSTKENDHTAKSSGFSTDLAWMDGYLHLPSNNRLTGSKPTSKTIQTGGLAGRRAVYLDRDGVLVEDVNDLRHASQLRVLPGVPGALRALQTHFYLVVVTNQSGIARGLFTEEDLFSIHSELVGQLSNEGVVIDAMYYCPHLPGAANQAYGKKCECRKPSPGMLITAKNQWSIDLIGSYMIGDRPSDMEAGERAGVSCIFIGDDVKTAPTGNRLAPNLAAAADIILADISSTSVYPTSVTQ